MICCTYFDLMWMCIRLCLVFETGHGNLPAVRVGTAKTVRFISRFIPKPDKLNLGRPIPNRCLSTYGFCWVWLVLSVPISGSGVQRLLCLVAFRYHTVHRKIFSLVHHCAFLMYFVSL